jgi:hypothetical protein
MQKALDQMSLQIHSRHQRHRQDHGFGRIDAIPAGERNPKRLAGLRDLRIRATGRDDQEIIGGRLP